MYTTLEKKNSMFQSGLLIPCTLTLKQRRWLRQQTISYLVITKTITITPINYRQKFVFCVFVCFFMPEKKSLFEFLLLCLQIHIYLRTSDWPTKSFFKLEFCCKNYQLKIRYISNETWSRPQLLAMYVVLCTYTNTNTIYCYM